MERASRDLDMQAKALAQQRQQLIPPRPAAPQFEQFSGGASQSPPAAGLPGALEISRDVAQARASREQLLQQLTDYEQTNQSVMML